MPRKRKQLDPPAPEAKATSDMPRDIADARVVENEYRQREWVWPDDFRMPYSVIEIPEPKPQGPRFAIGAPKGPGLLD